jgi:hypothetical protein
MGKLNQNKIGFLKIDELIVHGFDENNNVEIENGEWGYLISLEQTEKLIHFLTTQLKIKKNGKN